VNYKLEKRDNSFTARVLNSLAPIPHIHRHIELIYLYEGSGNVTVDKVSERLVPGELFISFPYQVHYFESVPVKGVIFIVSPELFPDLRDYFGNKLPLSPIIKKELLPADTESRLDVILRNASSDEKLRRIAANGYMQAFLAELLQSVKLNDTKSSHDSVKQVLTYCFDHFNEPVTLEALAAELHMSKDYISHIFTERIGRHFNAFINDMRVEEACSMLTKGCSITEVAFACGFGSVRSFNRNFICRMGISPSAYLKNK